MSAGLDSSSNIAGTTGIMNGMQEIPNPYLSPSTQDCWKLAW